MTGKTILLVEDELAIREMVAMALEREGFEVIEAGDAREAESKLADRLPDLVLLDWMLPGSSGIEIARKLRRDDYSRELPIIMLTARSDEDDRIRGLEAGADDYVVKPFSPRELIARIKAVLRRSRGDDGEGVLLLDQLRLDTHAHRLTIDEQPVEMGPTEFRLLHFLLAHPERVFSRGQLLDQVWGRGTFVEERTVDVHIRRLRKALEPFGYERFVQTVRGAGYRLSKQV